MRAPSKWGLVARNLGRRPVRSGLIMLCVAAAAGLMVSAEAIERGGRRALESGLRRMGADLVAVPRGLSPAMTRSFAAGEPQVFYMDRTVEDEIRAFPFVERTSPQLYVKSLSQAACCSAWNVLLVGFDPETDFTIRAWLAGDPEGRLGPDEVWAGVMLPVPEDGKVKFFGHEFKVAGRLVKSGMGLDSAVFIPLPSARVMVRESAVKAEREAGAPPEAISAVMIGLRTEAEGGLPAYRAAYELESALSEISIIRPDDMSRRAASSLKDSLASLRTAGYAVWAVTSVLIGLVFSLARNERKRELGLLRSLGADRGFLFVMVSLEAVVLTAAGSAGGIAAALAIVRGFCLLISEKLATPFLWPSAGELARLIVPAFGLAALTGLAASLPSALKSAGMEPLEAVRREE